MSICTQAQALSAYTPQQVSSDEIGIGEDERRCLNEAAACNNTYDLENHLLCRMQRIYWIRRLWMSS